MAYRRRQGQGPLKPFIFEEESRNPISPPPSVPFDEISTTTSSTSLAAKATRASSAQRDSSLSSAYSQAALSSASHAGSPPSSLEDANPYEYTSMRSLNESKHGFWGSLARKAKAVLDDDSAESTRQRVDTSTEIEYPNSNRTSSHYKSDSPIIQKRLNAFASSLNSIGGAIGNALEEGLTIVENRTADIIQETRKLHIRRKGSGFETRNQVQNVHNAQQQQSRQTQLQPQMQTDQDIQLKASRDVAMAMAAKAKLLLRELKTTKADLAFAKERCAQLEEENRLLRENREKGNNLEDDDMIRLQLETLLAEKARLAQENSVYSRENRFLREIVEYHQLTMQDVVYLDEGTEEVTEVYPIKVPSAISLPSIATTPPHPAFRPDGAPHNISLQVSQHIPLVPMPPSEFRDVPQSAALRSS